MRQFLRGYCARAFALPFFQESRPLLPDEAGPEGEADQAGDVEDLQAFHHLPAVRLHRLDAQLQPERHLLGRVAFGDELQDLPLPGAQRRRGGPSAGRRPTAMPARKPLTTTRDTALLM